MLCEHSLHTWITGSFAAPGTSQSMQLHDVYLFAQERQQAEAYGSTRQGSHLVRMETSCLPSTMLTMSMPLTSPAALRMPLPGGKPTYSARTRAEPGQLLASATFRAATSHRLLQELLTLT